MDWIIASLKTFHLCVFITYVCIRKFASFPWYITTIIILITPTITTTTITTTLATTTTTIIIIFWEPLRISHTIWLSGNSRYWHFSCHEIPDFYDQQLTKPLIIKWLVAPCYKVICMRKVPVSNFNFCQWCVNGLRMVATTLEAGSSFQINIYLRRRTDLYYQSRIIIS